MSNVQEKNAVENLQAAMNVALAEIRKENEFKTRQTAAKEQLAAALRENMGEVLRELANATYVDSRGREVISAKEVYDSLYTQEFAGIFKVDSNTPQEWQFTRITVGLLRKAVARLMKASGGDEAKAAWRAFAGTRNIGVNVDSVPSTNATIEGMVAALANLL